MVNGKVSLAVLSISLFFMVLLVGPVESEEETFLAGTNDFILCTGHAERTDTYLWTDVSVEPNIRIYTVNEEITKTEAAKEIEKYDNFLISSSFPVATTLTISDIELEDRGTYTCELLVASTIIESYTLHVEVAPKSILLPCLGIDECPPPPPHDAPSKVDCVCTAAGVFPESLQFLGNGDATVHKIIDPSLTGSEGSYDISSDFIVYLTPSVNDFTCELTGFVNTVSLTRTTASYTFRPPICELEIIPHNRCLTASLVCHCDNAAPDVVVYSFYDETKTSVGLPQTYNMKDVSIQPNEPMTFHCRGCNGVNYGAHSFAEKTVECSLQQSTARPPVVSTDVDRGEGTWDKTGVTLGIVIPFSVIIVAVIIYAFIVH